MTDEYIAGFFEGEGSIVTWKNPRGSTFVRICIPQKVHPEILNEIQVHLGYGRISVDRKGTSRLSFDRKEYIQDFLKRIYPHMVSTKKRKVAKLAWQILTLIDSASYPTTTREPRQALAQRIRDIQGRHA